MKEKLSVWKIYRNAYRYLISHLFAFAFLTIFYFIGSLLPILIGVGGGFIHNIFATFYIFIFFYFAASCYFKQQLLFDKQIFLASGVRFITAVVFFVIALLIGSYVINLSISFVGFLPIGKAFIGWISDTFVWFIVKYLFILFLFVVSFLIPMFAFVSEIYGKSKSLLISFAKTRYNIFRICIVALIAFLMLLVAMYLMSYINILIAAFLRSIVLVYISLVYFKMYDFFFIYRVKNKESKIKKIFSKLEE